MESERKPNAKFSQFFKAFCRQNQHCAKSLVVPAKVGQRKISFLFFLVRRKKRNPFCLIVRSSHRALIATEFKLFFLGLLFFVDSLCGKTGGAVRDSGSRPPKFSRTQKRSLEGEGGRFDADHGLTNNRKKRSYERYTTRSSFSSFFWEKLVYDGEGGKNGRLTQHNTALKKLITGFKNFTFFVWEAIACLS